MSSIPKPVLLHPVFLLWPHGPKHRGDRVKSGRSSLQVPAVLPLWLCGYLGSQQGELGGGRPHGLDSAPEWMSGLRPVLDPLRASVSPSVK